MTTTEHETLLHRYLRATRREYEVVTGNEARASEELARRAFLGIDLNCNYVAIRSERRRCEFKPIQGLPFLVLGLELSDRMVELDLLAQIALMKPDWVYAFFVVLLSDVFRQRCDLERYRYCVLKALGDTNSLRALSSLPKGGPPIRAGIVSVLLHELAHVVFRRNEYFIEGLREICRAALHKFADGIRGAGSDWSSTRFAKTANTIYATVSPFKAITKRGH